MIKGFQIKMARAALKLKVHELATLANVMPNTVSRIENGAGANVSTLEKLTTALENAGIEFIPENGGGAGVRMK